MLHRLDTFISAVRLLEAAPERRQQDPDRTVQAVSVLFVLVELGHPDFALNLLGALWPERIPNNEHFVWVIDRVMQKGGGNVREEAVRMLFDNADSLVIGEGGEFCWPGYLDSDGWNLSLSVDARELVALSLMRVAEAYPASRWHRQCLLDLVAGLEVAARKETDPAVRGLAARASRDLSEVLVRTGDCELLLPRGTRITISRLIEEMNDKAEEVGLNAVSDQGRGELEALAVWKSEGKVVRSGHTIELGVVHDEAEESGEEDGLKEG